MGKHDKRRSPRHRVEDVYGTLHFSSEGRVINMSLTGLALETSAPIRVNRSYSLLLRHGHAEPVQLDATAVWCHLREIRKDQAGSSQTVFVAGFAFAGTLSSKAQELIQFLERSAVLTVGQRVTGRFRLSTGHMVDLMTDYPFLVKTLSLHGMLIEAEYAPEIDSVFDVEVFLPDFILRAAVRVAYARQVGVVGKTALTELGIEFTGFGVGDRENLETFIARELAESQPEEPPR